MKTVKDWFKKLPENIQERALKNARNRNLEIKVYSLKEALSIAFVWEDSPEGYIFWQEIFEK